MTDPILVALDRLYQYANMHPEHDTDSIIADARAALAQLAPPAKGEPSDDDLLRIAKKAAYGERGEIFDALKEGYPLELSVMDVLEICRAVYRVGRPVSPPAEGELVAELNRIADNADFAGQFSDADRISRAAELLQQRHPALLPAGEVGELVASPELIKALQTAQPGRVELLPGDAQMIEPTNRATLAEQARNVRYEFSVVDGEHLEQAGGSAPTFEQTLSEGRRYLAQYQQDGPHTLEIRKVEILISGGLPLPEGAKK